MDELTEEAAGWATVDDAAGGGDGDTVVVMLGGEIDISVADPIVDDVRARIEGTGSRLVFDLSQVEFMDSSGISVLLRLRAGFDDVVVRAPSAAAQHVIAATGLGAEFPVEP